MCQKFAFIKMYMIFLEKCTNHIRVVFVSSNPRNVHTFDFY